MASVILCSALTAPAVAETGTVRFEPLHPERTPAHHRLDAHTFDFELKPKTVLPVTGVSVSLLTFPSPLESPYPENNVVHAEYYRPRGNGPFPAVIVLDILAGDQSLSRAFSRVLAQNNVAALFVQMAYYGPRRPPGEPVRLLSLNIPRTLAAMRQTVLDCRRATAWLESRPEIDGKKLGILGTSLGSFLAALTAESEPKLSKVALLYGGGGFVDGYGDHPRAKPYLDTFAKLGIDRDAMKRAIAKADPLTHAENLKGRDVLLVAAKRDDIVPPKMAEAMWLACGKPRIIWHDTNHYGAALFAISTLKHVLDHFRWQRPRKRTPGAPTLDTRRKKATKI